MDINIINYISKTVHKKYDAIIKYFYLVINNDKNFICACNNIYYSSNSWRNVKSLIDKLIMYDGVIDIKIQINSKQINYNTIRIQFKPFNITLYVINLLYDINKISNLKIWNMHSIIHRLCFFDIYELTMNDINVFIKNFQKKSIKSKPLYKKYNIHKYKLSKWCILLKQHYQKTYDELIYIGYPQNILKFIESNNFSKYKKIKSDHELRGTYYDCYSDNKVVLRIYHGKYYCYRYLYQKYIKIAHLLLNIKFYILDIIWNEKNIFTIDEIISMVNINIKIFKDMCMGQSMSLYGMYYSKLFSENKRPYSYIKNINPNN